MYRWLLWLAIALPLAAGVSPPAGGSQVSDRAPAPTPGLPWEPGSSSELLAASHILVVTLGEVTPSPWAVQPSGLEERTLTLRVRLNAVLKGEVRVGVGEQFSVVVKQVREPGDVVSDFHGFWSDQDPTPGASYLILSAGRTNDPTTLMQEPAIRLLAPAAQQTDVTFATAAEQRLRGQLETPASRNTALLDLLKKTEAGRQTLGLLAATYVHARASAGDLRDGPLVAAILEIVLARDTAPGLRSVLAAGLANAALDQDATPSQRAGIARGLFGVARVDADLFEGLVKAELYNLVFEMDEAVVRASEVVSDPAERARLAALLKELDDERADAVAAWLRRA